MGVTVDTAEGVGERRVAAGVKVGLAAAEADVTTVTVKTACIVGVGAVQPPRSPNKSAAIRPQNMMFRRFPLRFQAHPVKFIHSSSKRMLYKL